MADVGTLREVGEALFGVRWQAPLARALGPHRPAAGRPVNLSLLQKWVAGTRPLPAWVGGALLGAIQDERRRHLDQAANLARMADRLG